MFTEPACEMAYGRRLGHAPNLPFANVELIKGRFPECDTIRPENLILAHVDVDLYADTLACLRYLWSRMATGGRIYVDDAFWLGTEGATIAFCQFCGEMKIPMWLDNDNHGNVVTK